MPWFLKLHRFSFIFLWISGWIFQFSVILLFSFSLLLMWWKQERIKENKTRKTKEKVQEWKRDETNQKMLKWSDTEKNKGDGIQRSHSILSWIEAPSGPHTKNTRGTIGFVRVKGRKENSRYNGTIMACKWEAKKRARVQWKGRVSLGRKKSTWVQFIFF